MNITDIRIRKILSAGRLRAVVSVTLDDALAIHDIKIIDGPERLFVAMPSRREENGTFRDVVHPISPEARQYFEGTILSAYNEQMETQEKEKIDIPDTDTNTNTDTEINTDTDTQSEATEL